MKAYVVFAILLFVPSLASANDIPPIKAGLWSIQTVTDGKKTDTIKQCMNQEVFGKLLVSSQKMMGGACEDVKIVNNGGVYSTTISCRIMGSQMTSVADVKGDFKTSYTATSKTTMVPPIMGMGNSSQTSTASYLGECGDDMKLGDMIMADGKKMNSLQMMESMPNIGDMMKNMPDMSQMQKLQQQLQQQMQGG